MWSGRRGCMCTPTSYLTRSPGCPRWRRCGRGIRCGGLRRWADTDRAAAGIIAAARAEHAHASTATRTELDAARADAMPAADTPTGVREANARMAARLRAQHRHIVRSRSHAQLAGAAVCDGCTTRDRDSAPAAAGRQCWPLSVKPWISRVFMTLRRVPGGSAGWIWWPGVSRTTPPAQETTGIRMRPGAPPAGASGSSPSQRSWRITNWDLAPHPQSAVASMRVHQLCAGPLWGGRRCLEFG